MIPRFHKYYIKQRFFPNFFSVFINPFFLTRSSLLKELKKIAPTIKGNILDFGCGSKPYNELFINVSEYIGVDIQNEAHDHSNENIDVFYDGKHIPFDNESFQNVFSTEVFEHVPNINESIKEIYRVLKPNGKLLLTTPFSFPEHEMPFDFRRLSHNGIVQLLEENGFYVEYIKRHGTLTKVTGQIIAMGIHDCVYSKYKYLNIFFNILFISPIMLFTQFLSIFFNKNKSLYFGTIALAMKK